MKANRCVSVSLTTIWAWESKQTQEAAVARRWHSIVQMWHLLYHAQLRCDTCNSCSSTTIQNVFSTNFVNFVYTLRQSLSLLLSAFSVNVAFYTKLFVTKLKRKDHSLISTPFLVASVWICSPLFLTKSLWSFHGDKFLSCNNNTVSENETVHDCNRHLLNEA